MSDIRVYTQSSQGHCWLERYRGQAPLFACVLGFTETGLIAGISAAGATPTHRKYTAIADAEFLYSGPQANPCYPLPPLDVGASPVLISRAVLENLQIPIRLFNAGLPQVPTVPVIDLGGTPARCLSQGNALKLTMVEHLLWQGLNWGEQLAAEVLNQYLILGECVVGGTTTALAVLTGLGIAANGKVNSSHPTCNHDQKWMLVKAGLQQSRLWKSTENGQLAKALTTEKWEAENAKTWVIAYEPHHSKCSPLKPFSSTAVALQSPLRVVAAVGDPMQVVVAGMAIAASRSCGVLLAGGTQMLAVYALANAIAQYYDLPWKPEQVVVGTTRWVAEDPTGNTVGLAKAIGGVPLIATQLNFAASQFSQLRAYEQGYVKEGVGAGGCAIAAHLYRSWGQAELLGAIERVAERYQLLTQSSTPIKSPEL